MFLVNLLVVLVVVGVLLWAANQFIPMDPRIRTLINVLVVVAAFIYVLYALIGGVGFVSLR